MADLYDKNNCEKGLSEAYLCSLLRDKHYLLRKFLHRSREVLLATFAAAIDLDHLCADKVVDMIATSSLTIFLVLDDATSMAYGRGPGVNMLFPAPTARLVVALGFFHKISCGLRTPSKSAEMLG